METERKRERERPADLGSKKLPQWAPSLVQLRSRPCRSDTTMGIAFTRHFADSAGGPAARIWHPSRNYHLTADEADRHLFDALISIVNNVGRTLHDFDAAHSRNEVADATHDALRRQLVEVMEQLESLIDDADHVEIVQIPE